MTPRRRAQFTQVVRLILGDVYTDDLRDDLLTLIDRIILRAEFAAEAGGGDLVDVLTADIDELIKSYVVTRS